MVRPRQSEQNITSRGRQAGYRPLRKSRAASNPPLVGPNLIRTETGVPPVLKTGNRWSLTAFGRAPRREFRQGRSYGHATGKARA